MPVSLSPIAWSTKGDLYIVKSHSHSPVSKLKIRGDEQSEADVPGSKM